MSPFRWLYTVPLRLRSLLRREAVERDLDDELRDHLERKTAQYQASGLAAEQARRAALRDIGGLELRKEQSRDTRRVNFVENLVQDVRFAIRMLRKSPAFTFTAILMLGLGIGANTAIFSVVNAVMLRPLPFPDPDRIVRVDSTIARTGEAGGVSYPDFLDWQKQNEVFQSMAVFGMRGPALSGSGAPVRLRAVIADAGLLPLLGVVPVLGRWFTSEENSPGAAGGANAAILSYRAWHQYFGADPAIVGRGIELDHAPYTIVGVMPQGFQYPVEERPIDLWFTIAVDAVSSSSKPMLAQRGVHYLQAIARLKPGVTPQQAESQLRTIVDGMNREHPNDGLRGSRVTPERIHLTAQFRTALIVLLGAVGCVLLIACANLASLVLSRATARQREIAIRAALGAGRARLIQQLAVEHLALALLGGAFALLLAHWGVQILLRLAPTDVPRLQQAHIDSIVILFTGIASILCALFLGLVPVLQLSRLQVAGAVKEGSRGQTQGATHARWGAELVVSQIAATVVLLVGAALLMQTLVRLLRVAPGFQSDHVLSFRANMPEAYTGGQQQAFYHQLVDRLRQFPGVQSASSVFAVPLGHIGFDISYGIEGRDIPESDLPGTRFNVAEPQFFRTLGIPLLNGRDFTARDDLQAPPVIIINEALARAVFANENPIGKRLRPGVSNGYPESPWRTVIAVVRNVQGQDLRTPPLPELWVPLSQCPNLGSMTFVARTTVDPHSLVSYAQSQAAAIDRSIPLYSIKTLDEYRSASVAQPRFQASLLAAFAILSMLVAAVGLYGAISYSVTQRRLEWGIRLALGAQRGDILRSVLRQGATLATLGVTFGLLVSLVVARLLSSLLFGVTARDPSTFAAVAALLGLVALLASYVPARRATRVDPIQALRHE
jgi:putative ABC transport system permease protein